MSTCSVFSPDFVKNQADKVLHACPARPGTAARCSRAPSRRRPRAARGRRRSPQWQGETHAVDRQRRRRHLVAVRSTPRTSRRPTDFARVGHHRRRLPGRRSRPATRPTRRPPRSGSRSRRPAATTPATCSAVVRPRPARSGPAGAPAEFSQEAIWATTVIPGHRPRARPSSSLLPAWQTAIKNQAQVDGYTGQPVTAVTHRTAGRAAGAGRAAAWPGSRAGHGFVAGYVRPAGRLRHPAHRVRASTSPSPTAAARFAGLSTTSPRPSQRLPLPARRRACRAYLVFWLVSLVVLVVGAGAGACTGSRRGWLSRRAAVPLLPAGRAGRRVERAAVAVRARPDGQPGRRPAARCSGSTRFVQVIAPGHLPVIFADHRLLDRRGRLDRGHVRRAQQHPARTSSRPRGSTAPDAVQTAWRIQLPMLRKWIVYMVILSLAGGHPALRRAAAALPGQHRGGPDRLLAQPARLPVRVPAERLQRRGGDLDAAAGRRPRAAPAVFVAARRSVR